MSEPAAVETDQLTRRGLRLTQFTVAYNVVEGVVATPQVSSPGWCR